ncbi:MAG: hypothetical protein GYB68_14510 [Chloroflexi bacterium]|nr:hypothetical protein [Chloroflexota bacterium]
MKPEAVRLLFAYAYWGWDVMWRSIEQISDEQFTQAIDYSRGSIRHQCVHMISATLRWLDRLQERDARPNLDYADFGTRESVREVWKSFKQEANAYLATLTEADLNATIHWGLPARGIEADTPRWQILTHAANHLTDHRAQVLAMLNSAYEVETYEQDMLFFLLEQA